MTSTARLAAGVIGALSAPDARLNEKNAAFGVVIVCVAFAATIEVMMATTVAMRMTPGRENFWTRIVIAFILFGVLLCWFFYVLGLFAYGFSFSFWVMILGLILRIWCVARFATWTRACRVTNVSIQ